VQQIIASPFSDRHNNNCRILSMRQPEKFNHLFAFFAPFLGAIAVLSGIFRISPPFGAAFGSIEMSSSPNERGIRDRWRASLPKWDIEVKLEPTHALLFPPPGILFYSRRPKNYRILRGRVQCLPMLAFFSLPSGKGDYTYCLV